MRVRNAQDIFNITLKQVRKQENLASMYDLTKAYTYGLEEEGLPVLDTEGSTVTNDEGEAICVIGFDPATGRVAGK